MTYAASYSKTGRITSLFTQLRQAIAVRNYSLASRLQLEIDAQMKKLKQLYNEYKKNLF